MTESVYLTVADVAARARVTEHAVRKWIRLGRLPAVRIGGTVLRVRPEDFDALVCSTSASTETSDERNGH